MSQFLAVLVNPTPTGREKTPITPRIPVVPKIIAETKIYLLKDSDNVTIQDISPILVDGKIVYCQLGGLSTNFTPTEGEPFAPVALLTDQLLKNLKHEMTRGGRTPPESFAELFNNVEPLPAVKPKHAEKAVFTITENPMAHCHILNKFILTGSTLEYAEPNVKVENLLQALVSAANYVSDEWFVKMIELFEKNPHITIAQSSYSYCQEVNLTLENIAALAFFLVMFCIKPVSDGLDTVVSRRGNALSASFPSDVKAIGVNLTKGITDLYDVMSKNSLLRGNIICSVSSLSSSQYYPHFAMITSYAGTKSLAAIDTALKIEGGIAYIAMFTDQANEFAEYLNRREREQKSLAQGKYCGDTEDFPLSKVSTLYEFSIFVLKKHGQYANMKTRNLLTQESMEDMYRNMPKVSSQREVGKSLMDRYQIPKKPPTVDPSKEKNEQLLKLMTELLK